MLQSLSFFVVSAIIFASTARASDTKLVRSWKDPQVSSVKFTKVVVALVSPDTDLRRRVEGGLARRVRGGVAAHSLIPEGESGIAWR